MAIFCLARDGADMEERLARIVVAQTRDRAPVTAKELKAAGAMSVLLNDAIKPNLVQTLDGSPGETLSTVVPSEILHTAAIR